MGEPNEKRSQKCNKCGYNRDYERNKAFATIGELQNSIYTMGVNQNQMNIAMVQVKNENLILKNEIKILKRQINEKVQGGRKKKKRKSKAKKRSRLKVRKTKKGRKKNN